MVTAAFAILLIFLQLPLAAQDYVTQKEKIYIQTNHVIYAPDETVFFKAYVVRGADNTPAGISNVLYAELISPAGIVAEKGTFRISDGYAEGSFTFKAEATGGMYKIHAYTSWMLNEKETMCFTKEILLQQLLAPRILMKLDFPEKGYGPGSAVKADFSMRNLAGEPIRQYKASYTVFIGGSSIERGTCTTDQEGKAEIRFTLPSALTVNDGLLAVTVEYDAYTESVSRSIPIVLQHIDLQFMPEGGTLVQGLSSRIAFKAVNEFGKAADVSGELHDETGNKVADFSSFHMGMGRFLFTPQPGKTYKAYITSPAGINQVYAIPAIAANGVVLQIDKAEKEIAVTISCLQPMEVKLNATHRNQQCYTEKLMLKKGTTAFRISEAGFPAGIVQFTLYASNGLPLAERLVFLNEDRVLNVAVSFDKTTYLPREKVKMQLRTTDPEGNPLPANLSVAVVDDKLWTLADDKQHHILSWLLLGSELKGTVEEPQFYFKKDEPRAIPALDLLLMTQGYRYFDFIDYIVQEGKLKYLPDQDNVISGVVQDREGNPLEATLFLVHNYYNGKVVKALTDTAGNFFFSDLEPGANYILLAQSANKSRKAVIRLLQNGFGFNALKARSIQPIAAKQADFSGVVVSPAPVEPTQALQQNQFLQLPGRATALNEVVVTSAFGMRRRMDMTGAISVVRNEPGLLQPDFGMTLQGKVAGLQITRSGQPGLTPAIRLRGITGIQGQQQPLYVVNGVIVDNLNTVTTFDIESITILKDGSATALYGARAVNGVIIIETKKFRNERLSIKFANKYAYQSISFSTSTKLYTPVRRFYMPVYTSLLTDTRTDFRETIYWNPVVQTDAAGNATVEFYNSDASTTFRAVTEGIGYNGLPGRMENTYAVKNSLQVDAKIPPYLTVGDKALIPLVIRNNSGGFQTGEINVQLPAGCITDNYKRSFELESGKSVEMRIPLEAVSAVKDSIRFTVSTGKETEKLVVPVNAVPRGFPVKRSFSGDKTTKHVFRITDIVPGTLETRLQVFSSLEGQLLDGIESMLREPHGCFEQTSSSTYPNVFILKYLQESGKVNNAIRDKALQYIKDGYNRLISFETKENGFEWFGKTPPHEALTAYGLLEFTDMRPFVKVDEAMLKRTEKYLLSRRDGKGGFLLNNRGYDAFATVPDKIAHLYIVYALTEAGVTQIQPEYKSAVEKALASKDAYQLALMALAADNMKDAAGYNQLIGALKLTGKEPVAATSVVNSREASLRVETKALYALALMRHQQPETGLIAHLISSILSEKTYYGYGSTQATVLALKAITEFGRLRGKQEAAGTMEFSLNSQNFQPADSLNGLMKTGENEFSVRYNKEGNGIPYNLEVAYSVFTPVSTAQAALKLNTSLATTATSVGETIRMEISVENLHDLRQPMAVAKIGIPAGLSVQPWQLKELMEKNNVAYYEIFDNYLVFYWMGFTGLETKRVSLDLKADIPGSYTAKAGTVYLYYTPEYKHWVNGTTVTIR